MIGNVCAPVVAQLDIARKYLAEDLVEDIISECICISIENLKKLKGNFETPFWSFFLFFFRNKRLFL